MGIIYRPHRGGLEEAMKEKMEFTTFEELQRYIVGEMEPWIKLSPEEIVQGGHISEDRRIGWKDSDYLCIDAYKNIKDKQGYKLYFGGEYNSPQCIGMFATQWIQ